MPNLEMTVEKINMMVVDSNPNFFRKIEGVKKYGFNLHQAQNFKHAKGIINSGIMPDIILLDYNKGTFIDILRWIRRFEEDKFEAEKSEDNEEYEPTPIYVLQPENNCLDEQVIKLVGANGIIPKIRGIGTVTETYLNKIISLWGMDEEYVADKKDIYEGIVNRPLYENVFNLINVLGEYEDPKPTEKKYIRKIMSMRLSAGADSFWNYSYMIMNQFWKNRKDKPVNIKNTKDLWSYYLKKAPKESLRELQKINQAYYAYIERMSKAVSNSSRNMQIPGRKGEMDDEIRNRLELLANDPVNLEIFSRPRGEKCDLLFYQMRRMKQFERAIDKVITRIIKAGYTGEGNISKYRARRIIRSKKSTDVFGSIMYAADDKRAERMMERVKKFLEINLYQRFGMDIKDYFADETNVDKKGYYKFRIPLHTCDGSDMLMGEILIASIARKLFTTEICHEKYRRDKYFIERADSDNPIKHKLKEKVSYLLPI